jgi:hypothetical protein
MLTDFSLLANACAYSSSNFFSSENLRLFKNSDSLTYMYWELSTPWLPDAGCRRLLNSPMRGLMTTPRCRELMTLRITDTERFLF